MGLKTAASVASIPSNFHEPKYTKKETYASLVRIPLVKYSPKPLDFA